MTKISNNVEDNSTVLISGWGLEGGEWRAAVVETHEEARETKETGGISKPLCCSAHSKSLIAKSSVVHTFIKHHYHRAAISPQFSMRLFA